MAVYPQTWRGFATRATIGKILSPCKDAQPRLQLFRQPGVLGRREASTDPLAH